MKINWHQKKIFCLLSTCFHFFLTGCTSTPSEKFLHQLDKIIQAPINIRSSLFFDTWVFEGNDISQHCSSIGPPSNVKLRCISTNHPYNIVRKTNTNILVTPYLTWDWKVDSGDWKSHPVQVTVGLKTNHYKKPNSSLVSSLIKSKLPPHDTQIIFSWNAVPLHEPGFMHKTLKQGDPNQIFYTIRGGKSNLDEWHSEALDISNIYKKAWPKADNKNNKIVFIGIHVEKSNNPEVGYIRNLRLSN